MSSIARSKLPSDSIDQVTGMRKVTTSTLRNELGSVIDSLSNTQEGLVLVTHSKPKAVLIPYETYLGMVDLKAKDSALDFLTATYERLAESMNTPTARAAAKEAFDSGSEAFHSRPIKA